MSTSEHIASASTSTSTSASASAPVSASTATVPFTIARRLGFFLPGIGGFLAILLCSAAGDLARVPLLMAPFGASCVIAFALPHSPLAQPRSLIGGHVLSTLVGLLALAAFGVHAWSLALAVGAAITLMQLTRTLHPPAGADPLLVMLSGASWGFLLTPVLLGAALLVLVALLYHRATGTRYPNAWW